LAGFSDPCYDHTSSLSRKWCAASDSNRDLAVFETAPSADWGSSALIGASRWIRTTTEKGLSLRPLPLGYRRVRWSPRRDSNSRVGRRRSGTVRRPGGGRPERIRTPIADLEDQLPCPSAGRDWSDLRELNPSTVPWQGPAAPRCRSQIGG
jgi:hypothetical protein